MNVLFVASECAPFVKTGGLADVVGALPKSLAAQGCAVRVLLPAYPALKAEIAEAEEVLSIHDPGLGTLSLLASRARGIDLLLLHAPSLFDRPGNIYGDGSGQDWPDNALRFGALSKMAAHIAKVGAGGWRPDVLHAHDWQAGLAPAYLRFGGVEDVRTVTTIHNIAFQGVFPASVMGELALPWHAFDVAGLEYYGHVSFLKAGLTYADHITTVSPTYARELMDAAFGLGFEGIVAARRRHLSGIINGVDLDVWDPATDRHLAAPYGANTLDNRAVNRAKLVARFNLTLADDAPLFASITRLTHQKGIDLLIEAIPAMVDAGGGLVVLGSGETHLEHALSEAVATHGNRVGVVFGYDEPLSHLMMGGADMIVVPSRFEPCGLTQLYGLRYGCLPLVARTGGLADTVIDANEAAMLAGVANGFQFLPVTTPALVATIERASALFADRPAWRGMMARAMAQPVGWDRSAKAYAALYRTPPATAG